MNGNPLDGDSIRKLVNGSPPLIEQCLCLEEQLQPNGFDITLLEVARLVSHGSMGAEGDHRKLAETETLNFGTDDWLHLESGSYRISFNEVVNFPLDLMALGRTRSSLLRSGVSIHTAVWDAGYRGRSQALLVVHNTEGYRVQKGARLMQLIFFKLLRPVRHGYDGRFQAENL